MVASTLTAGDHVNMDNFSVRMDRQFEYKSWVKQRNNVDTDKHTLYSPHGN